MKTFSKQYKYPTKPVSRNQIKTALDSLQKEPYINEHNCTIRAEQDTQFGHCTQCRRKWRQTHNKYINGFDAWEPIK